MGEKNSPIFRCQQRLSVVLTLLILSVLTVLVMTVLLILLVLSVLALVLVLVVLIILIGHFKFLLWSICSVISGIFAALIFFAGNLKIFLPPLPIIGIRY